MHVCIYKYQYKYKYIYIYVCIHMYIEGHDVMMSFVEHECRFLKVN